MKKLYYFQHADSSCVWYEYLTSDECNELLNTTYDELVDLISEELYYKRIEEGYDYPNR